MKTSYKNKLASHLAVVAVCDADPAAWQDLKAFKDAFAGFKGCVTLIQELSPLVGRLPTGLTLDKQRVREQLADAVVEVASAARAHASNAQDGELAVKVNVSRSRLLNCRATESAELSQSVVEAIKPKAAQMADVGVTPQDLTVIEGLLEVYREKITQPREIRIQGKTARKQLEAEFAKADLILAERMDPLIPKLKKVSPGFAQNYLNARVIVDTRAKRKAEDAAKPAEPVTA